MGRVGFLTIHDRADGSLLGTLPYSMTTLPQMESACWVPEESGVLLSTEAQPSPTVVYIPV
jgi:hypothetical protein